MWQKILTLGILGLLAALLVLQPAAHQEPGLSTASEEPEEDKGSGFDPDGFNTETRKGSGADFDRFGTGTSRDAGNAR